MNYERIIVELLGRIQNLEEQMAILMQQQEEKIEHCYKNATTSDIREYISQLKMVAKSNGDKTLVLKSGNIHKSLNLKSAMPQVCNAMRQMMNNDDVILHTTPSGNSSTIVIEYKL